MEMRQRYPINLDANIVFHRTNLITITMALRGSIAILRLFAFGVKLGDEIFKHEFDGQGYLEVKMVVKRGIIKWNHTSVMVVCRNEGQGLKFDCNYNEYTKRSEVDPKRGHKIRLGHLVYFLAQILFPFMPAI